MRPPAANRRSCASAPRAGARAVRCTQLTKRYGGLLAVDAVSLQVCPGEIYGLLGLNGAGKSTTLRMLLGMARPSAGAAYVFGEPVVAGTGAWHRVGYLLDGAHAYPRLTVRENLELARRLHGVPDARVVDEVIELLALGRYRHQRAGELSLGNVQRLGLAKALVHRPELLVLDEPANGLDPAGIVELRELLGRLADEEGVAILVSSHILAEVARLASRVGIVDGGRLLTEFDGDQLARLARRTLHVDVRDRQRARTVLGDHDLPVVGEGGSGLELDLPWAIDQPDHVAALLVDAGVPPTSLCVGQEDLEAFFLRLLDEHRAAPGSRAEVVG